MPVTDSEILSVREVTHYIKHLLETDPILRGVQVSGEISNLKYHSSGHVYFSVKDAEAQLSCVMFRSYANLAPRMREGDQIIVKGELTVYPPRGNYQMLVRAVRKEGVGDLYQRFLELKEKLNREGLFDPAHKKPLPAFPRMIAVITSPTGAAVRDIVRTVHRRYNIAKILVIPAVVQGEQGRDSIIRGLEAAVKTSADLIILGRGGGSIEDLWNFNEEAVARAVFACPLPVISGVGHETDTTIVDFVADVRASTPTAAAERAVPDKQALLNGIAEYEQRLHQHLKHFIDFKRQVLDDYDYRLEQACLRMIDRKRHELELLETQLQGMDRTQLLEQGYTLTLKAGQILRGSKDLVIGERIETVFSDGRVQSEIVENS